MKLAREPEAVLAELAALRRADAPTHGGRVLSYVYDPDVAALDELAAAAVREMQPVNGLDPTAFGSVAALERDVLGFVRELLGGDDDVVGTVTSGGTESCLLAVKTARDVWRRGGLETVPRLVAPVTVHAAFHKAAQYFGLDLDLVPVGADGVVDPAEIGSRLGPDVALVVVSAPSYPHGALDPVTEVAAIAQAAGVPVHVDACLGGLVLPFWPDLPDWDLRVPGVVSLSADLHKYGYAPKGVSVLLQRGRDRQRAQYFATTRWPGYPVVNPTMLGSRSAGPLAAAWAICQVIGRDGFATLAEQVHGATTALRDEIDNIEGLRVVGDPSGPLLAVATDDAVPSERRIDPHVWADALRARGWVLQPQPGLDQPDGTRLPHTTHLTVTPVTLRVLAELCASLDVAGAEVRGIPRPSAAPLLEGFPPLTGVPDADTAAAILAGVGIDTGGELPPMAPLLAIVEALPAPVGERLLVELLARLVEPR